MSTDFDPGEGWCKHPDVPGDEERNYLFDAAADVYWVREEPVPPLPTVPYTVIRVFWTEERGQSFFILAGTSHKWVNPLTGADYEEQYFPGLITGFEVLSEPRAVTAKAVLDAVMEIGISDPYGTVRAEIREGVTDIRRTFGVES